jgi:hypothetical protein
LNTIDNGNVDCGDSRSGETNGYFTKSDDHSNEKKKIEKEK